MHENSAVTPAVADDRLPVRLDALPRERQAEILAIDGWAFPQPDPDFDVDLLWDSLDWERFVGAFVPTPDGERLVAVNTTYAFELTVPGATTPVSVPCAGLTWVGVHPQFRRRGVLTAMMRGQLRAVRELGREPVGALFASEPGIYGRFGYGLTGRHLSLTVPGGAALRPVPGGDAVDVRFEVASAEAHLDLVRDLYERARLRRPGCVSRPNPGTTRFRFVDPPSARDGGETQRILVARRSPSPGAPAEPTGYALFRRKFAWNDGADGEAFVREFAAVDAATEHALWDRLLNLDLVRRVTVPHVAPDSPLLLTLGTLVGAAPRVGDDLWVRVVDVPRALEARGYAVEADAVLEVRDRLLPENAGAWRLRTGPDGASCTPTTASADVVLDVRELGSAYLGGTTLEALARAGLVEAAAPEGERFTRLSAALRSRLAPTAMWQF